MKTIVKDLFVDLSIFHEEYHDAEKREDFLWRYFQLSEPDKKLLGVNVMTSHPAIGSAGILIRYQCKCIFEKSRHIWEVRKAYRQRNRKLWRKT